MRQSAACRTLCSNSNRWFANVLAPDHSYVTFLGQRSCLSGILKAVQPGTTRWASLPSGARLRLQGSTLAGRRSGSTLTTGARKSLLRASQRTPSEDPEAQWAALKGARASSRDRALLTPRASCIESRMEEVSTAPLPLPLPPHRCSSTSSSASGVEPTSRPPPRRQRAAVPPPERRPSGASRRTAIRAHAFGSLSGSHALLFADAELILFAVASFLASCDGCAHLIWSALMDTGRFASVVCVHPWPGARVAGCVWGPGSCRDVDCRSQCMPSG